jgi:hypothetical protein
VATSTYHIGPWALGVRSSRVEFDDALRQVLAAHMLDAEAPANFSIMMADDGGVQGGARTFNVLYRASQSVVKSRVPGRVMRGLLQYMSEFAESTSATLRFAATGVVKDGRAIVAPYALRWAAGTLQPRLNAVGMQLIDGPVVHVEPSASELVVPEPVLRIDADALANFDARFPGHGREPAPVAPGRYPIAAWALVTDPESAGPMRRAHALAVAAQQVLNADERGLRGTLEAVARCLAAAPAYGVWWARPGEFVQQLNACATAG